jgi:hypothetical protein
VIRGGIIEQNGTMNTVFQEVIIIKKKLESQKGPDLLISKMLKPITIDPKEITDPLIAQKSDRRGKKEPFVLRKSYKGIDVASIPITIPEDEESQANKVRAQLAILGKFRDSPNILKFYGLSRVDNQLVMVVEWAELRSLRETYNAYDIAFPSKVIKF